MIFYITRRLVGSVLRATQFFERKPAFEFHSKATEVIKRNEVIESAT